MDQDSFRKLLQTPGSSQPTSSASRGSLVTGWGTQGKKGKTKPAESGQPSFKPRTVKKAEGKYRDRAGERRGGVAGDYAQVEALAEDFEKRNADRDRQEVEEQRRYLGGDSEHTVLVKGLDIALLEQNKARQAAATEEDDDLEQAFAEAASGTAKKRTREDIVQELKNKRQKGNNEAEPTTADKGMDEAKKVGKFRPIGFKPIGSTEGTKKKVKKSEKEGAKKKKKKALMDEPEKPPGDSAPPESAPSQQTENKHSTVNQPHPPEPESLEEDFDIFAEAGEYTGVDIGSDEEDEAEPQAGGLEEDEALERASAPGRWFEPEEGELSPHGPSSLEPRSKLLPKELPRATEQEEGEEEEEAPMRLAPLVSSSVPSIKDLLAMDDAVEKEEKRKARKEKKKKGALTTEGKIDRDYQRLKAFTDKKGSN